MERELAVVRQLLDSAGARFEALAAGAGHPRVQEARHRLNNAAELVPAAAGGLPRRVRDLLSSALAGVATWGSAALLGPVLGLPAGWTVTITLVVVLVGLGLPITRLLDRWAAALDQRRTSRPAPAPPTPPPGISPEAELLTTLRLARRELTALLHRRAGAGAGSAAGFAWLCEHDKRLATLSLADRSVAVAISSIELWLPLREDRP